MISIIIPIFNEQLIILKKYNELLIELNKLNINNYEIIYWNDWSNDKSENIVREIIKNNNKVKIISWFPNKWMWYNHRKLYNKAIWDIIIEFDADFSTKPNIIKEFLNELNKWNDVVIASRYIWWKQQIPFIRKILSRLYNLFIKILFWIKIFDTQSGFIAFKKEVLKSIHLESNWFDIHIELIYKIINKWYKIKEIDWKYIHRKKWSKFNIILDWYKTIINTFKLYYKLVIKWKK